VIHIHKLRLTGARRTYQVDFDRRDGNLAIIAGPIHTGKTTVLQLVEYLLGGDEHPTHPELARTVRSAELEMSIDGKRWSVERPLFTSQQVAFVREGPLTTPARAQRKIIDPPGDPDALSAWLLDAIGLGGSRLRVTERNPNTSTHDLSIRDLMWLAFLPSKRLDNEALLHEGHDQKHYKLRQVIELLFDVHDDRLGQLLDQQKRVREERRDAAHEASVVETFLTEEEVAPVDEVTRRRDAAIVERNEASMQLNDLTRRAVATTGYAEELRVRFARARGLTARAAAHVRDREALYERLLPLRGQYAEDERKLVFSDEAKRLFDPLAVDRCPACLNRLPSGPEVVDEHCSLCGQKLDEAEEPVFSVDSERRALRLRIKDLDAYTERVEAQIREGELELARRQAVQDELARELDDNTARDLSPFVAERDQLVARLSSLASEDAELMRIARWYAALERRRAQVLQLTAQLAHVKEQLDTLRDNRPERAVVVRELSERFSTLLHEWGFPKVDDPEGPFIDDRFVPHVRGRVYRSIGSDGAKTLISLAWALSIFELAIERGAAHPGFLMLDSPQKNLAPTVERQEVDEYMDPAIVQRMYDHIEQWLAIHPHAQIIIVDHEPPTSMEDRVIVRYTRRADLPPYGLIEDQTGELVGA